MRQLSIDQLDNEGRRVSIYDKGTPEGKTPMFQRTVSMPGVHKRVIHELLRPRQWKPNQEDRRFMLAVSSCGSTSLGLLISAFQLGHHSLCLFPTLVVHSRCSCAHSRQYRSNAVAFATW